MNSSNKHNLPSDKETSNNEELNINSSPTKKRSILIYPSSSPSMRHKLNFTPTPEATINNAQQNITLKQIQLTGTNFTITGRLHYKFEINKKIGKFIFYDKEGNSCNILCFGENIENHFDKLEEKDVITISKAMPREANPTYTLCNSSIDLCFTASTTWKKLQHTDESSYSIPFTPSTIKEIKSGDKKKHELFDCIATITSLPEIRMVSLKNSEQQQIGTTIISDDEETIQLTAWGTRMVSLLNCCAKSKNAYAFSRLKRTVYNGNYALYLFEGAELYDYIDSDLMDSTFDYLAGKHREKQIENQADLETTKEDKFPL